MSSSPRVLVIYKRSAYEIYVRERKNARVTQLLEARDPAVSHLMRAHDAHQSSISQARDALRQLGAKATFRLRSDMATDSRFDLVVTLGGDGTLLWASHLVGSRCPVVAINSAPDDSVGYFCGVPKSEIARGLADALAGRLKETRLTRMRVELDGSPLSNRVLNDVLFSHTSPAATTRYVIRFGEHAEQQKSSGVWVATAAGSAAAIRSAGGSVQPTASKRLQFRVREPYRPPGVEYDLIKGFVAPGERLDIVSYIRAGRVYIDGPRISHPIDIGSTLTFAVSDEPLLLLGFRRQ